jgi:hypothetical protein
LFRPLSLGAPEVHLARLGSQESRLLLRDAQAAALHPSGYMLFVRQGALLAQRFDAAAGGMVGSEGAVAEGVLTSNFGAGTGLSVSASGVVAYRRGQTSRQLAWFDRAGRWTGQVAGKTGDLRWPAISAKGRIALGSTADGQIWLVDAGTSTPTQFTFSPAGKYPAIWSPDSLWLAFASFADGSLRRKRSNGAGDEEVLLPEGFRQVTDWSPDGKFLLLNAPGNIEVVPLEGPREPQPYLANPDYQETQGVFSPNGNWVAYESNESGRYEIYVRPFPDPAGGQSKVSSDGGSFARWSPDGRELYYLSSAGVLMAVPVNIGGDVFTFGPAQELFRTRIPATEMNDVVSPYDVSADGRFLMRVAGEAEIRPITVLLNWSPERER